MKKIIVTALAVFAFTFANAQEKNENSIAGFSKGDVFATGSIGLSSAKTGDLKDSKFAFAPKLAFFVTDNIAVGAKIEFGSEKKETKIGSVKTKTLDNSVFTGGVFGRYYFTPASKFSLFANLGVDFSGVKNKLNDTKAKQFEATLGAGFNVFLSPNFALECGVGALSYKSNDNGGKGAPKTNTFGLIGGEWTVVTLGLNYKF
ncbi:outer membrane beta-barrel protein [Flavobacterium succinicans]|uniref:Outer membrane protein beta-barrel domain-containing protein n=1 Tax=Flavobacterium succinicans TaxID=29536 RepID=A0A199XSV8_9FLAO|nr:outer membrane beta-barrel protein [Flavobacterium succinicans]OAZ04730.1 hypothetical protein FLB_05780 [Flavobacterium succinicans]